MTMVKTALEQEQGGCIPSTTSTFCIWYYSLPDYTHIYQEDNSLSADSVIPLTTNSINLTEINTFVSKYLLDFIDFNQCIIDGPSHL